MNVDYEKEASKEEKIITETLKKNFPRISKNAKNS